MNMIKIKRLAECLWVALVLAMSTAQPAISQTAEEDATPVTRTQVAENTASVEADEAVEDVEETIAAAEEFVAEAEEVGEPVGVDGQEAAMDVVESVEGTGIETAGEDAAEPEGDSDQMVVVPDAGPESEPEPGTTAARKSVNRREYVTIGGNSHLLENESAQEMVTIMGNAIVDGHVRRECVTILGNVTINGKVDNEVVCVMGTVTLGPNAEVGGELVSIGGQIQAHPTAVVHGEKVSVPAFGGFSMPSFEWLGQWIGEGMARGAVYPITRSWAWAVAGIILLVNLVFYLIFRRPIEACAASLDRKPAMAFVSGILVFLLFGPLIFLLLVSVIGILIVPFLFAGALVATICGVVAVYRYVGGQLGLNSQPMLAMLAGNIVFTILYGVWFIGIAVWMLVCLVGIGCATTALIESMRSEAGSPPKPHQPRPPVPPGAPAAAGAPLAPSAMNPGAPAGPAASAVAAGEGVSSVAAEGNAAANPVAGVPPATATAGAAPQLPPAQAQAVRVGFWPRLGATALDFLLIMALLALLDIRYLFLVVWLVYFVAFWSWRATTIGGIILNLRIERMDGRQVEFGVAVVRALASIFSFMPIGLGFMWASWDEERQSWHDKIAGTTVVRLPRGQPLL